MLTVLMDPLFANEVQQQIDNAYGKAVVQIPHTAELTQATQAFEQALSGQQASALWANLGMQTHIREGMAYIHEAPDQRSGRGLFSLRVSGSVQPWLLQAPHAKSDNYTGRLAALFYAEQPIKAAMWNTVHRRTRLQISPQGKTADMAHLTGTYWQAMTASFARQFPHGRIIQLHGYAQSKRRTAAARASDMIISAGHLRPPTWIEAFSRCMKKALPAKVSLYPDEVRELGATTNVQGHLLQQLGFDGFVHIEMSRPLRNMLLKRKDLRLKLFDCLS